VDFGADQQDKVLISLVTPGSCARADLQLGRHKSYNVLDGYPDLGEPFENHALNGTL